MPMHVRISDFGLAKVLDNSSEYEASGGKACSNALAHHRSVAPTFQIYVYRIESQMAIKWLAPECIERRIFTHKSDVWAFGMRIFAALR